MRCVLRAWQWLAPHPGAHSSQSQRRGSCGGLTLAFRAPVRILTRAAAWLAHTFVYQAQCEVLPHSFSLVILRMYSHRSASSELFTRVPGVNPALLLAARIPHVAALRWGIGYTGYPIGYNPDCLGVPETPLPLRWQSIKTLSCPIRKKLKCGVVAVVVV